MSIPQPEFIRCPKCGAVLASLGKRLYCPHRGCVFNDGRRVFGDGYLRRDMLPSTFKLEK